MALVEILILKGASPSSVAITVEVLQTANQVRRSEGRPPVFHMQLSGSGAEDAVSFLGVKLSGGRTTPDLLVVPGLAWATEAALTEGLTRSDARDAQRRLSRAFSKRSEIASSCSGVFLLASSGLLDGRRATTSWWLIPYFKRMFPNVSIDADAMVVRDDNLTTAGASMAQLDLMLSIVARFADPGLAESCARYLLVEPRSSQARFMAVGFLTARDERVAKAENWARSNLMRSFKVDDLAEVAGLSARTFARHLKQITGLSPLMFVQRLRTERAVELLETTRLSLDQISRRVGYADPSMLRGLLHRQGISGARGIRSRKHPRANAG